MPSADDPHDLQRFVTAQDRQYADVLAELRQGRKQTHWMWFVFPQISGLGMSPTSRLYAIRSLDEAVAYLAHPVLGPRLRECTSLATAVRDRTAREVFGAPDDMKFRSSMTLFAEAAAEEATFRNALIRYFGGVGDPHTLELIGGAA